MLLLAAKNFNFSLLVKLLSLNVLALQEFDIITMDTASLTFFVQDLENVWLLGGLNNQRLTERLLEELTRDCVLNADSLLLVLGDVEDGVGV